MGLHELHRHAEWDRLPEKDRTPTQRLAARTQGIITPANGVSLLGLLLTITGLFLFYKQYYAWGLISVGVGRLCDILDGHVARKTHTSSPFGEGLDAGFDKLVVIAACVLLMWADVLPVALGILILVLQIAIASLALVVRHDGTGLHPVRIGKYAMFGLWLMVGFFMLAHILPDDGRAQVMWIGGFLLAIAVLAGGLQALREYIRMIVRRHLMKR